MLLYNKVYFQSIKPILQAWLWAKKVLFFCEFLKSLYFACSGGMSTTRVLIVLKYYLILFCSSTSQKVKPRPSQAGVSKDINNGLLSLIILFSQKKSPVLLQGIELTIVRLTY
jgi:hypothetical protein